MTLAWFAAVQRGQSVITTDTFHALYIFAATARRESLS